MEHTDSKIGTRWSDFRAEIEKGVKIPLVREAGITQTLLKMEIGDSFVCVEGQVSACHKAARRNNLEIVTRTVGPLQTRVWLVGKNRYGLRFVESKP